MNTKKVAIKCTSTEQGAKIIEYLVGLGGKNKHNRNGSAVGAFYHINENHVIDWEYDIPSGYTEIQLPTTPEIGPEGKLMWVWDGDGENPKNRKRLVIFVNDFMCLAIADDDTRRYQAKTRVGPVSWDHCAEIEEPEQVELTMEEVCQKLGMNVKIVKK